ncbi:MAG TPA: hypothetical protein VLS93_10300 [Anaeromyxobacteraceae bacterium]|nr:hypothetical protein [Anaeromyxobacteraceae bacterium]
MNPAVALFLGAWALVDLLQVPLVASVLLAFWLTRRGARAWKATALAFACYTAWVVLTALLVPYAPSGFAVILMGLLLDPGHGRSSIRTWLLGSAAAVVLFWILPTAAVRAFSRRREGPR